ncbi:MAG: VCBS repeat-containing protein, partial [Myxococcota bacterium]
IASTVLELSSFEVRTLNVGDLDNDGDMDLVLEGNFGVGFSAVLSDGFLGIEASQHYEDGRFNSQFGEGLADVDGDGDLDILRANTQVLANRLVEAPYEVWLNDGGAGFSPTNEVQVPFLEGEGLDVEVGDLNGDDIDDVYLCGLGSRDAVWLGVR